MATLARRAQARGVTAGIAALLLLAGCGRGTPEQRVSSRGSKPVPGTEVPPPIEAPTTSTTAAPATATSAVPVPTSTTANTATQAPVSGPCATPAVTEFALSAIGGEAAPPAGGAGGGHSV